MINKLTKEMIAPFLNEIEREDMPQVAGKDIEEMLAIFEDNGIDYNSGNVSISQLSPTQEDFKPDKVKEMVANLKSNKMVLFPIVVSDDGYILDGHHRWLAAKELYGENYQIPAITIDLPKDKALLMFAKSADKIDETIKEHPDTVYNKDGDEIAHHSRNQPISFGYNYQGDMYIGPNRWHSRIADWYDEFDPDSYEFAPDNRDDMKFPGRLWPDEKIISFWNYPDEDDLPRVLKDIENEIQRIHDEFPEVAEEDYLELIKFDDEWTIDVYKKSDSDTSDPDFDDSDYYDSEDDEDDRGYSYEKTGTQVPIKDYTGQTEKEKASSVAQAQSIQHVLSPADPEKKKKAVAPGLGSRKRLGGMTLNQYHQFICTSEGKNLSDFLVNKLLTETPDGILDKDGNQIVNYGSETAMPFGYFKDEIKIGNLEGTHNDIWMFYKSFKEHAPHTKVDFSNLSSAFKFSGRLFVDEKVISFWEYPEKDELNKVLKDIENEVNRIKTKHPAVWGVKELPDLNFDDDWKIDVITDEFKVDADYNRYSLGKQVSIDDYTGQTKKEKEIAKVQAKENPHVLSPTDPEKMKRIAPATRKRAGMTPTQYQQFICTSEAKTLANFLVNKLLIENPDSVYDKEGEQLANYTEGGQGFGYWKGKMYLTPPNETHPMVSTFYKKLETDEERRKDLETPSRYQHIGGPTDKQDFKYAGRFWAKEKIVSFWNYPDGSQLDQIFRDIEAESIRLQGLIDNYIATGDEHDVKIFKQWYKLEFEKPKFDDNWKMDTAKRDVDDFKNIGQQISVDAYKNNSEKKAQWSPETMALQHTVSPGDITKQKKEVPPDLGSRKKKGSMSATQYQQYVCTSEGKNLPDFLVKNLLIENPDIVYDKDGNEILHHSEGGVPFGYYKGKMYVGNINTHHGEMPNKYPDLPSDPDAFLPSATSKLLGWEETGAKEIWGRMWPEKKIISFWKHPEPEELKKMLSDIANETELPIKFDNSWNVDVSEKTPDGILSTRGEQMPFNDYSKQLSKEKQMNIDFMCSETIADKLNEYSIKKKFNDVEFEFIYRDHAIEPFFTVLRDGVPVDRMPAHYSKEKMTAFMRQNFSKWQADYVKSFGSFFTQIPQQGQTQGVYTGMENKESLIDINVFLD